MRKTVALLAMVLALGAVQPASAGVWDPYEGYRARDLRWLGTAYTADGHMRVTVSYWRGPDPAALPSYWYTFVKSSVFSGEIVATEDGGFRLRHYWGSGRGCGPPIAVRQVSPRVLRFRVRDTTNPGQPVTALTAKDSIQLGEFVGDPPAC